MEKQKWLRFKDDFNWTIVMPDFDSKPHGFPEDTTKALLEYASCPCNPIVDFENSIIIHNSFIDQEKIEEAMKKVFHT